MSLCTLSCNNADDNKIPADTLVKINKSVLTRSFLDRLMPGGLDGEDSARYAKAYINSWIESQLIANVASKEIDMTDINKLVDQYRNELIMFEYSRRMYESHTDGEIPEDSIRAFYDQHPDEFVLTRPMVKGVYLKVADDSKSLPQLRKLYRSQKSTDVDNLDKSDLDGAVHYDYFRDNWIDWEQIEKRIPYDFQPTPDKYIDAHKSLDYSQGGFTYLLDINDVLHTGQTMPYEAARPMILDRLRYRDRRQFETQLKKDLYDNALRDGKITVLCDIE